MQCLHCAILKEVGISFEMASAQPSLGYAGPGRVPSACPVPVFRGMETAAAGWVLRMPMLTQRGVFPSMLLLGVYSQLMHKVRRASQWEGLVGVGGDSCRSACGFALR